MRYNSYVENNLVHHVVGEITDDNDVVFRRKKVQSKPFFGVEVNKDTKFNDIYNTKNLGLKVGSHADYYFNKRLNKSKDLYGDIDPIYQSITKEYKDVDIKIDNIVKFHAYDIEVFDLDSDEFPDEEFAEQEVKSITLVESTSKKVLIWGYKDYEVKDINKLFNGNQIYIPKENIEYRQFDSERKLLLDFFNIVNAKVQILVGFYNNHFDNVYLINRAEKLGIKHRLTKNARCNNTREGNMEGYYNYIQNVDYMDIFKKYSRARLTSYGLGNIANNVLGLNKLEMKDFKDQYINNFQHFIDYNIIDSYLLILLNEKDKLINYLITISNLFYCNIEDDPYLSRI